MEFLLAALPSGLLQSLLNKVNQRQVRKCLTALVQTLPSRVLQVVRVSSIALPSWLSFSTARLIC